MTTHQPSTWETFKSYMRSAGKKIFDYFGNLSYHEWIALILKMISTMVASTASLLKVIGNILDEIGHVLGVLKPVIGGAIELHAAFAELTNKETDLSREEEKEPWYKRLPRFVLYKREAWFRFFNIACLGLVLFGASVPLLAAVGISVAAIPVLGAIAPFAIPVGGILLCASASLRYGCHFITAIWERHQLNKKLKITFDPKTREELNQKLFANTQKIYESVGYSIAGAFGFAAAACTLTAAILLATGVGAPVAGGLAIGSTALLVLGGVTSLGALASSKIGFPLYAYIKEKYAKKADEIKNEPQKLAHDTKQKPHLIHAEQKESNKVLKEIKKELSHSKGISPFKKVPPKMSSIPGKKHVNKW